MLRSKHERTLVYSTWNELYESAIGAEFDKITGNNYDAYRVSVNQATGNWALMEFYRELYSEYTVNSLLTQKYRTPDVIIGLNAGFTAYPQQLRPVVDYGEKLKVPSIFTDFVLTDLYMYFESKFYFHFTGEPNPFRSPIISSNCTGRALVIQNSHFCGLNVNARKTSIDPALAAWFCAMVVAWPECLELFLL